MRTDRQGLNQGKSIVRESFGGVKLGCRNNQTLPHPSIDMDTEHLHAAAAVGAALAASVAGAAVQIGLDAAFVADGNI
jgi:hypothetical protein